MDDCLRPYAPLALFIGFPCAPSDLLEKTISPAIDSPESQGCISDQLEFGGEIHL